MLQEAKYTLKRTFDSDDDTHRNSKHFADSSKRSEIRRKNLESFQLVILIDGESEYTGTKIAELREIIDYVQIFDDIGQMEQFLQETSETTTFLIGSINIVKMWLPTIYNRRQIQFIYLYHLSSAMEQIEEYQMMESYKKIRCICSCLEELLCSQLVADVNIYQNRISVEYNHIIVSPLVDETTGDAILPWWENFIYGLTLIEYDRNSLKNLMSELKMYYDGNPSEINRIIEFENTYNSSDAVKWYTRPIFLYRIFNQALRQRNIRMVSQFGFFIKDLYKQLMGEHSKYIEVTSQELVPLKCYRGQIMSLNEIQLLLNQRYTFQANSMLSTTSDRQVAALFLQPTTRNDELQSVLFEITLKSKLSKTKIQPFAQISNLSFIPNEDEILFMAGTNFELHDFYYDEDSKIWLADVRYIAHKQELLASDIIGTEKAKLKQCIRTLAENLTETSSEIKDLIFSELIRLCPSFSWISAIELQRRSYVVTGLHKVVKEAHLHKIKELENALSIWLLYADDSDLDCSYEIGLLYGEIAIHCESIDDFKTANQCWDGQLIYYDNMIRKAEQLQNFQQVLASPNIYLQCTCNHEGRIADDNILQTKINGNNALIYYEKLLHLTLRHCPEDKHLLQRCYFSMGSKYYQNGDYDMAITFHEQFITLFDSQSDSDTSGWILSVLRQLVGMYYHHRRDYNSALNYQFRIYHLLHSSTTNADPDKIFPVFMGFAQIYNALNQEDFVKENLQAAQKISPEYTIERLYSMMKNLHYILKDD